jgi:hypothetical protein
MDEGMTAIAEEQAKPAIETQQPEIEADEPELNTLENEGDDDDVGSETEGDEAEGEEGTEPEPELLEIEFNGKKHKIPADLKDGFLMQSDYTKKTQEVAELRKTVEARQAEADANFSTSEEVIQARAALLLHDNQLEQFQNMNWQQLENEDPVGAMSAWRQFSRHSGAHKRSRQLPTGCGKRGSLPKRKSRAGRPSWITRSRSSP